jgi:hypothetical protein
VTATTTRTRPFSRYARVQPMPFCLRILRSACLVWSNPRFGLARGCQHSVEAMLRWLPRACKRGNSGLMLERAVWSRQRRTGSVPSADSNSRGQRRCFLSALAGVFGQQVWIRARCSCGRSRSGCRRTATSLLCSRRQSARYLQRFAGNNLRGMQQLCFSRRPF